MSKCEQISTLRGWWGSVGWGIRQKATQLLARASLPTREGVTELTTGCYFKGRAGEGGMGGRGGEGEGELRRW